ncbi:hypothetical protein B0H67DRAFT_371789 [Lasiosphaeris hirsuta]|uniref:Mitotic apparatus protein p62 n=1 Tax=Lasiosphaeris hirsuta TaxID=260670 RepID=A0AA39ZX55_9PEZI|nr:hypothetical protein B0H67DRAFT_371789 [Lasiosphaeris hirsuta]
MAPQIIRIPRTDADEDSAFILGQVTPAGSKPLNLKLVATEGEEPYVVKLRHDRIGELRASSSPCTPDEWEAILKSLLLKGEPVEGIEAGAEAHVGKSIIITIRRRVAGINQRLGAITLYHRADEGIQLFDWCGAAAQELEKLKLDLAAEAAKVEDLDARVAELRSQVEELTQSKKASEAEMLEKLCGLLNEKKVKIREQQRLLATANVDPSKLAAVLASRPSPSARAAGYVPKASRASKRKTRGDDSDESSDDGFEKMDVDKEELPPPATAEKDDSDLEDGQRTPDDDDDETTSEVEEEEEPSPPQPKKPGVDKGKGKAKESLTTRPKRVAARVSPSPLPPKAAATHRAAVPSEGSETESDDEL